MEYLAYVCVATVLLLNMFICTFDASWSSRVSQDSLTGATEESSSVSFADAGDTV